MRKQNWDVILNNYIESIKDVEFKWGECDCCTFAANFVQKITGIDPIPEFRGHYTTSYGSKRALIKYGKGTLLETMDSKFKKIRPSFCKRGDLVLHIFDTGEATGICLGKNAVFKTLDKGIVLVPMKIIKYTWEVS